jgi:hypothetical protein
MASLDMDFGQASEIKNSGVDIACENRLKAVLTCWNREQHHSVHTEVALITRQ